MKNYIYAVMFGALVGCAAFGTICLAEVISSSRAPAGQACATWHGEGRPCPGYPDEGVRIRTVSPNIDEVEVGPDEIARTNALGIMFMTKRTELDMLKQQVAELTDRVTALEEQNKETK